MYHITHHQTQQQQTPIPNMKELEIQYFRLWADIMADEEMEKAPQSIGSLIYQHLGVNTQLMVTQQQLQQQQQHQASMEAERLRLERLGELAKQRQQRQETPRHNNGVRTRS